MRDRDALDQELARLRDAGELREGGTASGIAYDLTDDDEPVGVVDDALVLASTRDAFRAVVAASKGASLADAARYGDALERVPTTRSRSSTPTRRSCSQRPGPWRTCPRTLAERSRAFAESPVVASVTANADEIAIEASGSGQQISDALADSDAQVEVGQLPGDSWLALATPPLGPAIRSALDAAGVHDQAAAQVRRQIGLDLDADLLEPLGGLGLFVRGTSVLDIGGGLLLQLTDADAAQRLLTRVQAIVTAGAGVPTHAVELSGARGFELQIPQSPQPIVVLQKGDRIAAGYAASSAQDLLDPQERFDDSAPGKAAIATLGDGYTPSFVLLVPPLAGLLSALDELEVADLSDVLPYVGAYRSLAIGTKRDGDRVSVRIVAALR